MSHPEPPLIRIKDIGWLVYLYPLRLLARILPLSWLYAFAPVGGRLCQNMSGSGRRCRARLTAGLPAATGVALDEMTRCYYKNTFTRFLDDLVMDRLMGNTGLPGVEIRNLEGLETARAQGKGVLLIGVHSFGARLGRRHLRVIGLPILSLRDRLPPDPWAGRFGQRYLRSRYSELLSKVFSEEVFSEDPDCALKLAARLREGGLVYVAIDAEFAVNFSTRPFLGEDRRFGYGYLTLARLLGCSLVPLHCRGNFNNLTIEFGDAIPLDQTGNAESFVAANLPKVLDVMTDEIRRYPAEWQLWIRW
jgi:lauroyl/myristoyl acyltransferase